MANDYTYRADHVGSLLPPPVLLEARGKHARGEIAPGGLQEAENAAVKSALDMQRSVGIAVATDGGFRRVETTTLPLDGNRLATSEAAFLKTATRRPIKVAVPTSRPTGTCQPREGAPPRAAIVRKEYEALAERLFTELPVDRFLLPFAGAGDTGFEPLRLVPKDKLVVLGLVSATTSALEGVDKLMSQIDVAAKSIDGDNLALSPASGF